MKESTSYRCDFKRLMRCIGFSNTPVAAGVFNIARL
jgi:hypothetical protein